MNNDIPESDIPVAGESRRRDIDQVQAGEDYGATTGPVEAGRRDIDQVQPGEGTYGAPATETRPTDSIGRTPEDRGPIVTTTPEPGTTTEPLTGDPMETRVLPDTEQEMAQMTGEISPYVPNETDATDSSGS